MISFERDIYIRKDLPLLNNKAEPIRYRKEPRFLPSVQRLGFFILAV